MIEIDEILIYDKTKVHICERYSNGTLFNMGLVLSLCVELCKKLPKLNFDLLKRGRLAGCLPDKLKHDAAAVVAGRKRQ